MPNLLERLIDLVHPSPSWRTVRRSTTHPVLGALSFEGQRNRRDGPVHGVWRATPPEYSHPVWIGLVTPGEMPAPEDLARFVELLGQVDVLFERGRAHAAEAYEQMVEEPLPADWKSVLRLDGIDLPDPEDGADAEWQVTWWCEPAQHWLVVWFRGSEATSAGMEG